MKIGVVLPNWIGDLTMATPALRALRKHFVGAEIIGVLRPYLRPVLAGTPWIDRFVEWEHKGPKRWRSGWNTMRELRGAGLDRVILLRNSLHSAVMARLWAPKQLTGYARNGRTRLLSHAIAVPRDGSTIRPESAVDAYLRIAYAVGCPLESRQLQLATTPADETLADDVWQRLGLPVASRVIVLNTGGAFGAAKHWPIEHCIALAQRIAEELHLGVLVNCGPQEREIAAEIEAKAGHPLVRSLGREAQLPIGLSKACIKRARLLVTTDSGPRHLAAALGTPTVGLFGPIHPAWSENYQAEATQLRLPLECSPCNRHVCPLTHHRCMRDLSVETVFRAVNRQLQIAPLERAA